MVNIFSFKGKPIQLNLKQYLEYFLEFREETIRRRTNYFKNTLEKLEILEGLSKTKDIKKVIEITKIRECYGSKSKLIQNFS